MLALGTRHFGAMDRGPGAMNRGALDAALGTCAAGH